MAPILLHSPVHPRDDVRWHFTIPPAPRSRPGKGPPRTGKQVSFTEDGKILFDYVQFPSNRILHNDDPSQFVLASFGAFSFRTTYPDEPRSSVTAYMKRFFTAGLFLNGVQYRFYGHSNSQLRSRGCFLRAARSDSELDKRIYALGDFENIKNIAKRAKRIGLLFSGAEIDYELDSKYIKDIPDIKDGDELFSDGCGLISKHLSQQVSAKKKIVFRGKRYTPSVFQIRYKSYKGVVMLHPLLDKERSAMVHFRKSMKKFNTTIDTTFSIVDYSVPYAYGRLNADIIVLLSALRVPNERLLAKQASYFKWISDAGSDPVAAMNLLSAMGNFELVEDVLIKGLDDPAVQRAVKACQNREVAGFKKAETGKERPRMLISKSRLLFGVCDPFKVLKPGEVHVRVTTRDGAASLKAIDVMVIRNPCLHPGDLLKLRATEHPALSHLVDCVVFASQGKRAAPSMSSGGDLDGDKFFVCWDEDIVPAVIAESYTYPPGKDRSVPEVSRADMANYFASYNTASLAKVSALHRKWSICKGAMSPECQELNALHSQSVDGGSIKIPDRLLNPPAAAEPFILDLLIADARTFAQDFLRAQAPQASFVGAKTDPQVAHELLVRLLGSHDASLALSEEELVDLVIRTCRQTGNVLQPQNYLSNINFGALPAQYKLALSEVIPLNPEHHAMMWNSLFQSDILKQRDLTNKKLDKPLRLQRLYSSRIQGRASFFEYLHMATEDFTRKVILLRTDARFSIGVFIRGRFEWDADPFVDENVMVCSFQPTASETSSTYRTMKKGFVMHCSENLFQLYERNRGNTMIFINRPPVLSKADLAVSIALQKIDASVQRQIGRVYRLPVDDIEIHVVSHRDREAHQLFDLRFQHVVTEEVLPRFPHQRIAYQKFTLRSVDWSTVEEFIKDVFYGPLSGLPTILPELDDSKLRIVIDFSIHHHADQFTFALFQEILSRDTLLDSIGVWLEKVPVLVYSLLKYALRDVEGTLLPPSFLLRLGIICQSIIRSANQVGITSLVAFEKISSSLSHLTLKTYFDLLWMAAMSIRSLELCREVMVVMSDSRAIHDNNSPMLGYAHKHGLAIACDRAEEAADACPCDDFGKPTKRGKAPASVAVFFDKEETFVVHVHIRVDREFPVRLGSHVRLRASLAAENDNTDLERIIMDGVVTQSGRGQLRVELFHAPPPETEDMGWLMYVAGSTTTSRAMMDAVLKLATEGNEACGLCGIITGAEVSDFAPELPVDDNGEGMETFNESQRDAIRSISSPMSLIWGPPGTGKTTVVVAMLVRLVKSLEEGTKILMTASTHNAVDNVLERFVELNLLNRQQVIRVATDYSKVSKKLQAYTIDAALGGSPTDDPKLIKKAEKRVKDAVVVFTTCTGAGLGTLRKVGFDIVIIDEASQVTEPCALIPLVKGCKRAILVGDHVQLRPTVRPLGEALEFDMSLMERLYSSIGERPGLSRAMLDVQYRFPEALARFPSQQFYEGRLKTGTKVDPIQQVILQKFSFPWPVDQAAKLIPNVFVQCSTPEDYGRASKGNLGQVELVAHIIKLLTTLKIEGTSEGLDDEGVIPPEIAVLSPYSRQVKDLKGRLPSSITVSTIDGFQGRESDIVVFTTVRSNINGELGFVDNPRRLNVAWTRARWARIVIGDKGTLSMNSELWRRAIADGREVVIEVPEKEEPEHGHGQKK